MEQHTDYCASDFAMSKSCKRNLTIQDAANLGNVHSKKPNIKKTKLSTVLFHQYNQYDGKVVA